MSLDIALHHAFGTFELDLSFSQSDKGVTALFGPSGAGKSLTINMIAGLETPLSGHISLNNRVLFSTRDRINIPSYKRRIGYVFQDARLFPHKTIRQNLLFGAKRTFPRPSHTEIEDVIAMLDIAHLLDRFPSKLSGGEKQRVAIGRALLRQPDLLLLDEPLSALDHRRQHDILCHLETIKADSKIPILLVTHSMNEVSRLADDVILLKDGKLAAQGSVYDITSRIDLLALTGQFDAASTLNGIVKAHLPAQGMSLINLEGNKIYVPQLDKPLGSMVRIRIKSRDVMLSKNSPTDISANNILPVTIQNHKQSDQMHVDVQLRLNRQIFLSQITTKSWDRLNLQEGMSLYAVLKSVQLL
ncbi:molybdenum ABC transporter ATP-binding protein [Cohaesibacter intestini]|uniref:molybdenum ABC transporter ATP-binding protein n=1 Tax=Cohaesibacter intestini TaxID=2211145 RepID=UPI000DEA01E7|nr:molybdenum ABC transporter ATP-binding protein [Cohaesibacter intestini]